MRRSLAVASMLLVLFAAAASPSWAGKKTKKQKSGGDVVIVFNHDTRELAGSYFVETHGRGNCPPGLAKKNNGCLPPGQAKKRYVVGHALPPQCHLEPLPPQLSVRIGPPPSGYRYGIVDGDLVKLAIGTALVVDAIDGLVN
jgi:hypothetical protein